MGHNYALVSPVRRGQFGPLSDAMKIDAHISLQDLRPKLATVLDLAGRKIQLINKSWDSAKGTPVFTVGGRYTSRGWTEWTQGFQFGMGFLHFDGTADAHSLALARDGTV